MKKQIIKSAAIAVLLSTVSIAGVAHADNPRNETMPRADNTEMNARDVRDDRATADTQLLGATETEALAAVRRSIVADDRLSTYAHNVKILFENDQLVLRGPVESAEERKAVETAALSAVPNLSIRNDLEVITR